MATNSDSKMKKLYKYKSLNNMEHVLDIVFNNRLYCERWDKLNDPMEACYELYAESESDKARMDDRTKKALNVWRVVALAASNKNYLLWSHYADGHRGIAIEVDIPVKHPYLEQVKYDILTTEFSHMDQTDYSMRHLLCYKREEWKHEKEYRIIIAEKKVDLPHAYFSLPMPIKRIYVGSRADQQQVDILDKALAGKVKLVHMAVDKYGRMKIRK